MFPEEEFPFAISSIDIDIDHEIMLNYYCHCFQVRKTTK